MKTSSEDFKNFLKTLGFKNKKDFKRYMTQRARLNEYGAICYTERRKGYELNYSNNCRHKFGIGGYIKGVYQELRFN